jgi:L-methionine (R)-S-oxide reductase
MSASEPSLDDLQNTVKHELASEDTTRYGAALREIASAFGAVSATLHRAQDDTLHMVAYLGLPDALLAVTRKIPFGKGIAGACAARGEPVELCNLQIDTTGVARASAKQTGVAGAIAVPVWAPDGALVGTLGVGKAVPHDYTAAERGVLAACASLLGGALAAEPEIQVR